MYKQLQALHSHMPVVITMGRYKQNSLTYIALTWVDGGIPAVKTGMW